MTQAMAQMPPSKSKEVAAKIAMIPIKAGEWTGKAYIQAGKEKIEVNQWEKITYLLDSTVILIEGIGTSEGVMGHHAVAILGYDPFQQKYLFRSFKDGYVTDADCKLHADGKFEWLIKSPQRLTRYTIWLENKQWHETGEFSLDSGKTWQSFFEMKLQQSKP
ncbi:MAG: hypothetical protein ACK4TA_03045 [Saprospiraceae bacterium]